MASASFVEIISHFAGYLQIFHDIARDRLQYDETLAPGRSDDYTTLRPNYDYPFTPDDMETRGGPVPDADSRTIRWMCSAAGRSSCFVIRSTPTMMISSRLR